MLGCNWDLLRSKFPQLLAVLSVTTSAVFDGMQYGWASPIIPILERPDSPVQITEADKTWLEVVNMIGGLIGLPITICLVDRIGRKKTILFGACNSLIASALIAFGNSVSYYYVARVMGGLAADLAFVTVPMYIAEIADQYIRGFLSALIYVMMLVGLILVYAIAPYVSILTTSAVGAFFLALQVVTFPFMPDSPYYLLLRGRTDQAKKELQRLRATKDVQIEMNAIQEAVDRQNAEGGKPLDLLRIASNRKALIIMVVLNASQHFSSYSVILMNLHMILEDAGPIIAPNPAAIIFAVVLLFTACVSSSIVDKYGRKFLLVSSSLATGISLAILAVYFAFKNAGVDVVPYNWVPVFSVMLYAVSFKLGLGIIPIVLTAELFPISIKALGMTIADGSFLLFSIISLFLYRYLSDLYGLHAPFFLFALSCIVTSLFVILYIPETKGRTLEEIQFILKGEPYYTEKRSEMLENTQMSQEMGL